MTQELDEAAPPPPSNGGIRHTVGIVLEWFRARLSDPKRRNRLLAPLLVSALLLSAIGWWLLRPPEIAVLAIEPRPVEVALSVVARVRPENLVDVRSPNAGQIIRLLHDDGDVVAAGAPLAIVRSTVEQAQTNASAARERAARAELDRAQLAFNRTRTLADRGFASDAALDEARATLRSAQAGLAAAAADRNASAAQTREFTIRAPMAGIVLVRPIDDGQVISPETTLFQLGSREGIELQADVDEAYADVLRIGMEARAALSGSEEIFAARIMEISPRVDPTTGGRLIKLAPVETTSIPPGRSVDVTIVVARREAGISVPRQAVIDATTAPNVYVVDASGRVTVRSVVIADWPSLNAIIDDGLNSGDRIVLTPSETAPGARVRVRIERSISTTGG